VTALTRLAAAACLLSPVWLVAQSRGPKPDAAPLFVDLTVKSGITFVHNSGASLDKFMVETFGSGLAWIDYDSDGFPDLYFVNGAAGTGNALYHNNKNGTFTDVTARAGVAADGSGKDAAAAKAHKTGVGVGDYDNDGYLDLYVTAFGPNTLFHNNGDGTFTDVTAKAGVAGGPNEWSTSTGFFDYDRDGRLDLYVVNYLDYRLDENPYCGLKKDGYRMYCHPTQFDGMADRLFHNNGDGTFTDVSKQAGIANPAGKGLGVTFCDYDRDGDTDIYVANDTVRNFLYRNNGDGTFTDVAYAAGVGFDPNGKPQAGMGTDCADVDGNGYPDIFVTNFSEELNALYQNRGDGTFDDVSATVGMGAAFLPLGFGTKMYDVDNDGDLDIHVTNGHVIDNVKLYQSNLTYAQKDLLFENIGGTFRDFTARGGPALRAERIGRGLAVADFDNDGNLDVAIASLGQRAVLLRNQGVRPGNWIMIRAKGKKSNSFGLGATVKIQTSEGVLVREINNAASYLSSNDVRLHAGVGAARTIQEIEILWPSGTKQVLKDVAVNQILVVEEPSEKP
jgi:enediyne biosynthesis protein E4